MIKPLLQTRVPLTAAGLIVLAGCNSAHTVDILGSYFPFWLISMLVGVAAALSSRFLFVRLKIEPYLGPLTIIYLCVMISASCITWLLLS